MRRSACSQSIACFKKLLPQFPTDLTSSFFEEETKSEAPLVKLFVTVFPEISAAGLRLAFGLK